MRGRFFFAYIVVTLCVSASALPQNRVQAQEHDPSEVNALIDSLKDERAWARSSAAQSLAAIGQPAVPSLIKALKHENSFIRFGARNALTKMGQPAVPALIEALQDETDDVRWLAAVALSRIRPKSNAAAAALLKALEDKSGDVRFVAAEALAGVESNEEVAIAVLVETLKDERSKFRSHAVRAIGTLGPRAKSAIPVLIEVAAAEKRGGLKHLVFDALAKMGRSAVPALIDVLKTGNGDLRRLAAFALDQIGPEAESAVSALIEALKDERSDVSAQAAGALASIGPEARAAVPALIRSLKHKEGSVRRSATLALGVFAPNSNLTVRALIEALGDESEGVSAAANQVLTKIGEVAVPELTEALKSEHESIRYGAAQVLGRIGPEAQAAIPTLKKALQDESELVRSWAARALATIRTSGPGNDQAQEESSRQFQTVALSGDPAPGLEKGKSFCSFGVPQLNDAGDVALPALVACPDPKKPPTERTFEEGLWIGRPGNLDLVARAGGLATGNIEGVDFLSFQLQGIDDSGKVAIVAYDKVDLAERRKERYGIWIGGAEGLSYVAGVDEAAPGTEEGSRFAYMVQDSFVFGGSGKVAFMAGLQGPSVVADSWGANDRGIWAGSRGNLSLIARAGARARGTGWLVRYAGDVQFTINGDWGFHFLSINSAGQIGFIAKLRYLFFPSMGDSGIWVGRPGHLSLITQSGDRAPGVKEALKFGSFQDLRLNAKGQVAFRSSGGIWVGGPDRLSLVSRIGSRAPGTEPRVSFRGFGRGLTLTDRGEVAFLGLLAGPGINRLNGYGIWLWRAGHLRLLARANDRAPGTGPGIVFNRVSPPEYFGSKAVGFSGELTGPGIDSTNNTGVWALKPEGGLIMVVLEGDLLEVAPGDSRKIRDFTLGSANNSGQLPFTARFTDGSLGAFIAPLK